MGIVSWILNQEPRMIIYALVIIYVFMLLVIVNEVDNAYFGIGDWLSRGVFNSSWWGLSSEVLILAFLLGVSEYASQTKDLDEETRDEGSMKLS